MSNQEAPSLTFSHIQAKLISGLDNGSTEFHRAAEINQRGAALFPIMKHDIGGFQISKAIVLGVNMAKRTDAVACNDGQGAKLNRRMLRKQVSNTPSKERHHNNVPLLVLSICDGKRLQKLDDIRATRD
ncbi:hypothetical protein PHYPSEUDO_007189 [Phytophthora pseudosyringae]|uniref:Uncharacterized protein n=1 Tax=Phytophthora pseudosyringae TaxID=221518 RepID=A0A8T1VHL8_9STRA|nr:hypothetical protein PHYPSEUDO_007189 [Phytophthora pseudosyringae]